MDMYLFEFFCNFLFVRGLIMDILIIAQLAAFLNPPFNPPVTAYFTKLVCYFYKVQIA